MTPFAQVSCRRQPVDVSTYGAWLNELSKHCLIILGSHPWIAIIRGMHPQRYLQAMRMIGTGAPADNTRMGQVRIEWVDGSAVHHDPAHSFSDIAGFAAWIML